MPAPFDIDALAGQVIDKLNGLLKEDITAHVAFADKQAERLARQAAWIAEATLNGELNQDDRMWFLENLAELTENFARTVAALTLLTLEKAWNAVVGVIWGAINTAVSGAIGTAIPLPGVPKS